MKKFLWVKPSILSRLQNKTINWLCDFDSINATNRVHQPLIDRTNTCRIYSNKNLEFDISNYSIPDLNSNCLPFIDICSQQASAVLNLARMENKKIVVFYSGGLDSTTLLSSLVLNSTITEIKDLVYIALNNYSIKENISFYKNIIIANKLQTISTDDVLNNKIPNISKQIFVSGDPGISCTAVNILLPLIKSTKLKLDDSKNFDHLCKLFYKTTCDLHKIDSDTLVNNYKFIVQASARIKNIEVNNMYDFRVWQNINFRYMANVFWMAINMEKIFLENPKGKNYWQTHFIPFYHTDQFQIWDYQTKQDGLNYLNSDNNPKFYKPHHKKLINLVNYDEDYTLYKGKKASLDAQNNLWSKLKYLDSEYIPYSIDGKNAMV